MIVLNTNQLLYLCLGTLSTFAYSNVPAYKACASEIITVIDTLIADSDKPVLNIITPLLDDIKKRTVAIKNGGESDYNGRNINSNCWTIMEALKVRE